jgi:hypothetical protein
MNRIFALALSMLCGCGRIGFTANPAIDAAAESPMPDASQDAPLDADAFTLDAFAPDAFARDVFAPDAFARDVFALDAFAPDAFAPDAFAPDAFAPDAGAAGCDVYVNDRSAVGDVYTTALGDDASPGTPAAPFETLAAALAAATEGAVVCLDVGTYVGDVDVGRSVSIVGARRGVPACGRVGDESVIQGRLSVAAGATDVVVDGVRLVPGSGWRGVNVIFGNMDFRLLNSQVVPGPPLGGFEQPGYVATPSGTLLGVVEIRDSQFEPFLNDAGCSALWVRGSSRALALGPSSLDIVRNCFGDSGDGAVQIEGLGRGGLASVSIQENVLLSSRHARGINPAAIAVGGLIGALVLSRNVVRGFPRSGVLLDPSALVAADLTENQFFDNGSSGPGFANLLLDTPALPTRLLVTNNDLAAPAGSSMSILATPATAPFAAPCNWYGAREAPAVAALVSDAVDPSPYLTSGVDSDLSTPGFQPAAGACRGL